MRFVVFILLLTALTAHAETWRTEPVTDVSGSSASLALEKRFPAAAIARCDQGTLIAGGLDEEGKPLKRVMIIGDDGGEITLPDLPVPLAYAGAAMWTNGYCVAGGYPIPADTDLITRCIYSTIPIKPQVGYLQFK